MQPKRASLFRTLGEKWVKSWVARMQFRTDEEWGGRRNIEKGNAEEEEEEKEGKGMVEENRNKDKLRKDEQKEDSKDGKEEEVENKIIKKR